MIEPVQKAIQAVTASSVGFCAGAGWTDTPVWTLLVAGLIGGFLRAKWSRRPTWSRETGSDVLVGAAVPVILDLFKSKFSLIPTTGASLLQLTMIGLLVGFFASYVLSWMMYKVGIFKTDVRADAPSAGG